MGKPSTTPVCAKLIHYQIANGVQGITVFGSTGGMGSFSESERRQVIEVAAKHINGRVRFLPGTGSITTAEADPVVPVRGRRRRRRRSGRADQLLEADR